MTTPVAEEMPRTRPGRWHISLADLIVLVLAVGVSAGIARQAREAWGSRLIGCLAARRGPRTVFRERSAQSRRLAQHRMAALKRARAIFR
jgi:hypothetical protein